MIVVLFSCSKSWSQSKESITSSTGKIERTDTSKVLIPISFLREANAKFIERLYLINVRAQQDSIINLNKLYMVEQGVVIKDFQGKVIKLTTDNNNLKVSLNKEYDKNKRLKRITIVSTVIAVAALLIR